MFSFNVGFLDFQRRTHTHTHLTGSPPGLLRAQLLLQILDEGVFGALDVIVCGASGRRPRSYRLLQDGFGKAGGQRTQIMCMCIHLITCMCQIDEYFDSRVWRPLVVGGQGDHSRRYSVLTVGSVGLRERGGGRRERGARLGGRRGGGPHREERA